MVESWAPLPYMLPGNEIKGFKFWQANSNVCSSSIRHFLKLKTRHFKIKVFTLWSCGQNSFFNFKRIAVTFFMVSYIRIDFSIYKINITYLITYIIVQLATNRTFLERFYFSANRCYNLLTLHEIFLTNHEISI